MVLQGRSILRPAALKAIFSGKVGSVRFCIILDWFQYKQLVNLALVNCGIDAAKVFRLVRLFCMLHFRPPSFPVFLKMSLRF